MQIYLPIAEVSVNAFLLLGLGGIVGILSGMFGVGGGFLMTPLLFFIGIPPAVAVATEANQIVASSFSGLLAHLRRKTVDLKMGIVLLVGGLIGAAIGVQVFAALSRIGQVDLLVRLCYVVFLGIIGALMFVESLRAIRRARATAGAAPPRESTGRGSTRCPSRCGSDLGALYLGDPAAAGGVFRGYPRRDHGGGRRLHHGARDDLPPGMPTKVVVGTSLFQIIFVTGFATLMHATTNYTVDMVLAVLLLVGASWARRSARGSAPTSRPNSCASCWRSWCWRSAASWPSTFS
jgi:uncharacterized membrane protein YfcA